MQRSDVVDGGPLLSTKFKPGKFCCRVRDEILFSDNCSSSLSSPPVFLGDVGFKEGGWFSPERPSRYVRRCRGCGLRSFHTGRSWLCFTILYSRGSVKGSGLEWHESCVYEERSLGPHSWKTYEFIAKIARKYGSKTVQRGSRMKYFVRYYLVCKTLNLIQD